MYNMYIIFEEKRSDRGNLFFFNIDEAVEHTRIAIMRSECVFVV